MFIICGDGGVVMVASEAVPMLVLVGPLLGKGGMSLRQCAAVDCSVCRMGASFVVWLCGKRHCWCQCECRFWCQPVCVIDIMCVCRTVSFCAGAAIL